MSQDYVTIQGSDYLSDSRVDINTTADALRTFFAGATAPANPVAFQWWFDTTTSVIKLRNSANDAWITIGQLGVANMGHLPLSGGTMTGILNMGGYTLTNLGLGTGTAAARQQELDLKAPLAAPALTGNATVNQDPAGDTSLIRRSWAEGRYLKLSGGTLTGALLLAGDASADLHPVPRQQLSAYIGFNTTTGHRHDGNDARKVRATDLDWTAQPTWSRMVLPDNWQVMITRTVSIGWTTFDASAFVPSDAHAAMLVIDFDLASGAGALVQLRKTGTTPSDPQEWQWTYDHTPAFNRQALTFVDCVGQQFDYTVTVSSGTVKIYLLGYLKTSGS